MSATATKFLLAKGFTFQAIADAAGVSVMTVYRGYLGQIEVPPVLDAARYYKHAGKLPAPK